MKLKSIYIMLLAISFSSVSSELRCGWLQNPTPSNQWITDKDGIWDISIQGRFTSDGIENVQDFPNDKFVRTNGNYGYGCACIRADMDRGSKKVMKIYSSKILPLARCQNDKSLHVP
ncbi:DUF4087 domain-containing protein [Lelliottia wanjuensis]|uniref:DUF4087 domain-containing protein n=1 Tax=Lelliottia wanjuensis TaxID=3050585 RepID=UPI00254A095A|nr:DUF4087 domain-containing protein [Lelliottia sp. V104_15]MDK9606322.1 DUF4087 domain-containing protein [Lelliottia sp. V104_15]